MSMEDQDSTNMVLEDYISHVVVGISSELSFKYTHPYNLGIIRRDSQALARVKEWAREQAPAITSALTKELRLRMRHDLLQNSPQEERLVYNSDKNVYEATLLGGMHMTVDGDVFAEAVYQRLNDMSLITRPTYDRAWEDMSNPYMWDGDMDGVTVTEKDA